jgi:hypothetical protein
VAPSGGFVDWSEGLLVDGDAMSGLQVTPAALSHAAAELRSIAEEIRVGMASLDDEVNTVVGGSWSSAALSRPAVTIFSPGRFAPATRRLTY